MGIFILVALSNIALFLIITILINWMVERKRNGYITLVMKSGKKVSIKESAIIMVEDSEDGTTIRTTDYVATFDAGLHDKIINN